MFWLWNLDLRCLSQLFFLSLKLLKLDLLLFEFLNDFCLRWNVFESTKILNIIFVVIILENLILSKLNNTFAVLTFGTNFYTDTINISQLREVQHLLVIFIRVRLRLCRWLGIDSCLYVCYQFRYMSLFCFIFHVVNIVLNAV